MVVPDAWLAPLVSVVTPVEYLGFLLLAHFYHLLYFGATA
jgi:hypothetical protein